MSAINRIRQFIAAGWFCQDRYPCHHADLQRPFQLKPNCSSADLLTMKCSGWELYAGKRLAEEPTQLQLGCKRDRPGADDTRHCNRHTFASKLVMAGLDLRTVAGLLGHRTLQVVMRYSHLAPQHQASAVDGRVKPENGRDAQADTGRLRT